MPPTVSAQDSNSYISGNLEQLRQPILEGICALLIALAWLWWLVAFPEQGYPPVFPVLVPPLLPSLAAVVALVWRRLPMPIRGSILLTGVEATFILAYLWDLNPTWLYYQSLVVIIASLLMGPGVSFLAALAVTVLSAAGLSAAQALSPGLLLPISVLVWATAVVSWLSSRSLYLSLNWSLSSQAQAWRSLDEVQRRREQLRSTLDSLRHAHDALERTTRDLQAATTEAEQARAAKSRFVANISHELRTPLNVIVGFAELLVTSPTTYGDFAWPQGILGDLLTIWRNSEHLLKMIDDVLDLAQIESARFPLMPEPTDLGRLIQETLLASSSLARRAGLELRVDLPEQLPSLSIDGTRIRQVLINLLSNAVRYTASGFVEVRAVCRERSVQVSVRDSGRGIPSDRLEAIFEEFERAGTTFARTDGGAGLGLAISRQFVRLHGGRMWAESTPGVGSTFHFTLPLPTERMAVQPAYARRAWSSVPSSADEERPLLVLCQDPAVGRTLERHLEGKPVVATESLDQARALVTDCHPDALLIACEADARLLTAADDGRLLLESIAPFDLPVLVTTFPTERRASIALQVAEFLIKPVSRQDLLEAVRRTCGSPKRVLVIDDDPDMLRLLGRILCEEWRDCHVVSAASAEEAVDYLSPRPSVILLDLLMPGINGVQLLSRLEADANTANIPVVVVTARGPAEEAAGLAPGELRLLRRASFSAGDITRILELVSKALPPRYGVAP